MKTTSALAFSLAAVGCFALPNPVKRSNQTAIDDKVVLNFALTLEHLENAFYSLGLSQFDEKAFDDAGLPSGSRGRFVQIAEHEKTHVDFLTSALGSDATKACEYSFPFTDPRSFAVLSGVFEGVGTSAYTGAAHLLQNKDFVTSAASILATEGRQASWVTSFVLEGAPWGGAFQVPFTLNEAFTLAAPFITSCPSTNPILPVKAFPALNITSPRPGANVTPTFDAGNSTGPLFLAFLTGLDTSFTPLVNGVATIPSDLIGVTYAVVTTNGTVVNDDTIVAGPVLVDFGLDSNGNATA